MTTLSVPDMSCNHCKATVETALGSVPESGTVKVDLTTRQVEVTGPAPVAELIKALDQAGYPATVA
ncbi:heavy-metal-associated domain-containing protein [Tabrizicola sp.]|uniref:heavy-metal-associated domain-containing protein n=1 Tax=Tabrizicola sp. TaxID=2005166 RepID=UPI002734018A|nr:heavy metal-associated domain-containing protein [Tabrizicola sp.]MDP3195701.1 heavy metal-associated domain-containing protein [Tabrizicola sp.]